MQREKLDPQATWESILPSETTFCMMCGVGLSWKSPDPSYPCELDPHV